MSEVERFEDLDAWKEARVLTNEIYAITKQHPLSEDLDLRDQLRGASLTVTSNIAKAFDCETAELFEHYLDTSRASAFELISLLYLAFDSDLIDPSTLDRMKVHIESVQSRITHLLQPLRGPIDFDML